MVLPVSEYGVSCGTFSDDHLPSMGECDDNRYHFDRARLELFEEREAVDALTKAHLYPVFAHAYALVLSKLQEELPVYVRFPMSGEKMHRSGRFSIGIMWKSRQ